MTLRILEFEAKRRQERYGLKRSLIAEEARRFGVSSKDPERTEKEFLFKFQEIRSTFKNENDVLKATENVCDLISNRSNYADLPIKSIEAKTILDLL